MFVPILGCLLLLRLGEFSAAETGCPEPEDVAPCKCKRRPTVQLICSGLDSPDTLQEVFSRSERYYFQELQILDSVMQYIPSDIFEKATVSRLFLSNVTLGTMFSDLRVDIPDIRSMFIANTTVIRTITAQNFTHFTGLKDIVILKSTVSTIPKLLLPTNIVQFTLSHTGTKHLASGAFSNVPNLNKFGVLAGRLKTLSRDSFPRPFNVRTLSFNRNQISSISADMFEDMPRLSILFLNDNALTVLPESAFAERYVKRILIDLEGNPLQCDCQLRWLIKDQTLKQSGTCDGPEELKGRKLQDLTPAEISC